MNLKSVLGLIVLEIIMGVCSIQAWAEITAKDKHISVQRATPVSDLQVIECSPLLQPRAPWQKLGNPLTYSSYTAGHLSTDVKLVVVDRNGDLQGATIGTNGQSDHFSDGYELHGEATTLWRPITGAPVSKFSTHIIPVILEQSSRLWLLVTGADGNIHVFNTDDDEQWVYHRSMTDGGEVRGRISAAMSNSAGTATPNFHVVYSTDTGIKYLRVTGRTWRRNSKGFDQYKEGVIGSNDQTVLFFAFRTNDAIEFYTTTTRRKRQISLQLITEVGGRANSRFAKQTAFTDLSNVEFLGDDFHVLYTEKTSTALKKPAVQAQVKYRLKHLRFVGPELQKYVGQTVSDFLVPRNASVNSQISTVTGDRKSRLKVYRNHLLAAMTEVTGQLRYARWEYANDKKPWIVGSIGEESLSRTRPSLVVVNALDGLSKRVVDYDYGDPPIDYDYDDPHIGYDLLTVVVSNCAGFLTNLSREIFKKELAVNHSFYTYVKGSYNPNIPGSKAIWSPTVYLNGPSVPATTEEGIMYWFLPESFLKNRAVNLTNRNCTCPEGGTCPPGEPKWPEKSEACKSERLPIKLKYKDGIAVYQGQINLFHNHYGRFFEEFGHYVVSDIGFSVPNSEITDKIAERAGISVSELQKGKAIFREGLDTDASDCDIRCTGFVTDDNYDLIKNTSRSMEHAALYPLYWYFSRGDDLRARRDQDLEAQSNPPKDKYTLLSRKYEWIKKNIFHGVEFGNAGAPH